MSEKRALRVFVIAGEASGDSHGAELVRALRELDPTVEVRGLGGPALMAAGVPSRIDFVAHSAMGLIPVVKKLPFFRQMLRETAEELEREPPDVLVPIDYPGFNLRLARRAREAGIYVCYYVAPQRWAWATWRTKKVARSVDHLLCLFPFEKPFFESYGIASTHVGHPIFDALRAEKNRAGFRDEVNAKATDPIVALLPGSRAHEVEANLPIMVQAARAMNAQAPDARFLVPCANAKLRATIDAIVAKEVGASFPLTVVDGLSREIARRARVAIVTSGTATLELLFHEVPMVVVYRGSEIKYRLVKRFLLNVPHVSLVNILAGREVVPELIGSSWTADDLAAETLALLRDGRARKRCLAKLETLKREVSARGASKLAAQVVLDAARERLARNPRP